MKIFLSIVLVFMVLLALLIRRIARDQKEWEKEFKNYGN
jgi:hypothetical protein